MPVESNFDYSYVGDGNVYLIAGGGKIYTDMAARFVRSEKPVVEIIESPYDAKIVKNILESRHYSALEFDRFLIAVEGYSRVTETQLVRKRNASYMIKSGRAELNGKRLHKYVVPEKESTHTFTTELTDVNGNGVIVDINGYDLLKLSSMFYDTGLEEGYPEENLRYWKLQSTEFKAVICMNAHGLRDWFQIRCCFDDKTEVLTTDGWKFFKDLNGEELFYSMDPKTRNVDFVKSKELIVEKYKGTMIHVKGSRIDLCTTPNHNNLVSVYPSENSTRESKKSIVSSKDINDLQFLKAEEMNDKAIVRMTRTCNEVTANALSLFTKFDSIDTTKYPRGKIYSEITVYTADLFKLIGWYISDGSLSCGTSAIDGDETNKAVHFHKGSYRTCYRYATMLSDWFQRTIPIYKSGPNCYTVVVHSPQLYNFLKQFGTSAELKNIPSWIWNTSKFTLRSLLTGLLDGDTTIAPDGHGYYSTISKQLADDVQRLLLHCGLSGSIRVRPNDHESKILINNIEHTIKGKHVIYNVSFTLREKNSEQVKGYDNNSISEIDYDGIVYCVNLERHNTLYVRRNGTPVWSGNCKNAQYEIRDLANKIRRLCISVAPDLFEGSGPSCAELGYCPEGRLQNAACKGKIPLKAEVLEAWRMHKDSIKSGDDLK